jgi:hypothetical protein
MLRVSPPVSGLDTDIPAADLARLTGMPDEPAVLDPGEPEVLGDLRAAVGAYTGFGAASPVTAEIVGGVLSAITAAVTAAIVIDRASSGSAAAPHLRQDPRPDMSAAARAWRELTAGRPPLYAVRDGIRDVARTPALPTDGQMCAVFAVDIAGFTRRDRDDDIRRYLHEKLYEFLQKAFDHSGVPWDGCFREDRGDGALIVVPPEFSFKAIIDPLPERLRTLIRRHNHVSREAAAIQLRAAAHIGPVDHDGHGFVGTDINFLFRMLEARPLKRMLAASGTELALVVSDYVYHNLVCRYPSLVHPDTFQTVRFQTKDTRARAWTYLPGASA